MIPEGPLNILVVNTLNMKIHLLSLSCLLLFASCVTTNVSKRITPIGHWEYSITGTPEGDFAGILTVSSQGNLYSAKLNTNGNDLHFETFAWDKTAKKVSGEFYYSGTPVYFSAVINGVEMTGSMSAGGADFPFKAARKTR